jgi:hypothetical protein
LSEETCSFKIETNSLAINVKDPTSVEHEHVLLRARTVGGERDESGVVRSAIAHPTIPAELFKKLPRIGDSIHRYDRPAFLLLSRIDSVSNSSDPSWQGVRTQKTKGREIAHARTYFGGKVPWCR